MMEATEIVKRPSKGVLQAARTSSRRGLSMIKKSASFRFSLKRSISHGSAHPPRASLTRNSSWSNCHSCPFSSQEGIETNALQERVPYLLEELGGMVVLKSIIQEFCRRILKDPVFELFFQGSDMCPHQFTAHQERFFAMAFTDVNLPQASLVIRGAHRSLFEKGLSEDHFDMFLNHFAETLADRGFAEAIIRHASGILAPIRDIFEDAAEDFAPVASLRPERAYATQRRRSSLRNVT
jgi:truncated hemoglobin YjbI